MAPCACKIHPRRATWRPTRAKSGSSPRNSCRARLPQSYYHLAEPSIGQCLSGRSPILLILLSSKNSSQLPRNLPNPTCTAATAVARRKASPLLALISLRSNSQFARSNRRYASRRSSAASAIRYPRGVARRIRHRGIRALVGTAHGAPAPRTRLRRRLPSTTTSSPYTTRAHRIALPPRGHGSAAPGGRGGDLGGGGGGCAAWI